MALSSVFYPSRLNHFFSGERRTPYTSALTFYCGNLTLSRLMPNFRISFVAIKGLVSKKTKVLRLRKVKHKNLVADGSMKVNLPPNKAS